MFDWQRWLLPTVAFFTLMGCDRVNKAATTRPDAAAPGIAVIELFTSEGCSSCPPADKLLADLVQDARAKGTAVYPLALHVDYWNRLGWVDKFSDAEYSRRQQNYCKAMGLSDIYTPQMIVNGTVQFIGSDRDTASHRIHDALAAVPAAQVSLTLSPVGANNAVHVRCTVTGHAPASDLAMALVEREIKTDVSRGENGGRRLEHENVVRAFTTIALADKTEVSTDLALPASAKPQNCSVVAFVQTRGTLQIVGAASADVPPPSK